MLEEDPAGKGHFQGSGGCRYKLEVLGKVLSARRLEILARIPVLWPKSIAPLARSLPSRTSADVMFLADLGLIELKAEGGRKDLIPIVRFSGIEVDLGAAA